MIRLIIPSVEEDDFEAVREVLASGYLVQGARVAAFEEAVAKYVGASHAVAVSNCTAALHLSLLALDVRPGDLVFVTSFSWIATANVIELCGAQPVFVDIDLDTFNMDPNALEAALERVMAIPHTARRAKAILPVHTFGQVADMPSILELSEKHGVPVLEDAACALGGSRDGRQAGTWGKAGCFSFHPRKAITTGEGGIIVTDDAVLASRVRALRNHGQDPDSPSREFIMPGFNYRMTDFQGALGLSQMAKLGRIISARRELAARYDELFHGSSVRAPKTAQGCHHVYQSYVVLLPEAVANRRDELMARLKERGVETTLGAIHMPMTRYFRSRYDYHEGDFPGCDAASARSLTLPLYEGLREDEQRKVVGELNEACAALADH